MFRFLEKYPLNYSPLRTAMSVTGVVYFGLFLLLVPGWVIPGWVWLSFLVVLVIGIVMQSRCSRVIYMRMYDTLSMSTVVAVFGVLTWAVLVVGQSNAYKWFAGMIVAVSLILVAILTYLIDQRSLERRRMPCGSLGKLDERSGMVVDPNFSRFSPEVEAKAKTKTWVNLIIRMSPLAGGLSLLLVRGLPDTTEMLLLLLPGVFLSVLAVLAAAKSLSYLVATRKWEQQHGKQIHVKR